MAARALLTGRTRYGYSAPGDRGSQVETQQRVVRRNWIFWRMLVGLAAVAVLLFVYTIVQQNLAESAQAPDTGPIRLLDIQSATTALLATVGALLARAQYATAVRPMIGFQGRAVRGLTPDPAQLAWASRISNGAQDAATIEAVRYSVRYVGQDPAAASAWMDLDEMKTELTGAGLRPEVDFSLVRFANGFPLSGHQHFPVSWFTSNAMAFVDALGVNFQVTDRVGDVHERSMDMLKGANLDPQQAASGW